MLNLKLLSDGELEKIHYNSLKILEKIGVKIPNEEVLKIFKNNGAEINFENNIAKIPSALVENALKVAVDKQNKYYKNNNDLLLNFKGWMSENNLQNIYEYREFIKRTGSIRDLLNAIVIGNSLKNIERISCFVKPEGYSDEYSSIINYFLLYLFSKKRYFIGPLNTLNAAKCIIEMAKVIAENEFQLKNGSLVEFELEAVENLVFSGEDLLKAIEFSRNKMKILPGGWYWMGYHTPMTYASAITLSNANILAAITITILINPDCMFFDYVFGTQTVNLREKDISLFGGPNQVIFSITGRQLANFYGFKKCISNAGLTDSMQYDFQSGFERGVTAALAFANGTNHIGLQGIVGADQGVSFEELLINNEYLDFLNFIFNRKIEINDKTFNFEDIQKKGVGGNFLDYKKNINIKDVYWDSDIFVSEHMKDWSINKIINNIGKKINEILEQNFPPELLISEDKVKRLEDIIMFYTKDKKFLSKLKRELNSLLLKEIN